MKILWIVNTIFPYPSKKLNKNPTVFGGWLTSLAEELIKLDNFDLAIATTYSGKEYQVFNDAKIKYYLIPDKNPLIYNCKLEKTWQKINDDFKPDIVHIHGSEYPRGLSFVKAIPKMRNIVLSIQGLIGPCSRVLYANLPYLKILQNVTIRDILKPSTGLLLKNSYSKRNNYEKKLIKNIDNIIGRTTWDYANSKAINSEINYYVCNEILRNSFYNNQWDYKNIKPYTIFISQSQMPLKGFHHVIEALKTVKEKYPDVMVRVAGNNIFDVSTFKQKLKLQSYTKYLIKLVNKYKLNENIKFTGYLNEQEVVNELLKANIYVQASSIENSSNSLCEAMILGVPCVASFVGGTDSILTHEKEGYLYPFTEPEMLANYIIKLFEDKELAIKYGMAARKRALIRHDKKDITDNTISVYNKILGEKK